MRSRTMIGFTAILLAFAGAQAQMMTERYVPIGQSPGISGKESTIGRIVAVDPDARTMTVEDDDGRRTYRVTDETHIWLDRSGWKLGNLAGSYRDCSVGRRVEVLHARGNEDVAEWVKVESREPR